MHPQIIRITASGAIGYSIVDSLIQLSEPQMALEAREWDCVIQKFGLLQHLAFYPRCKNTTACSFMIDQGLHIFSYVICS